MKITLYRSPEGDGGAILPPSMLDLDRASQNGNGTTPVAAPAPVANPNAFHPPNEPNGAPALVVPSTTPPVVPPVEPPVVVPPEKPVEPPVDEPPSDEPEEQYWDVVDKLTGEPVTVEYGEIDPTTPEGAALRDKAVRADAVKKFEDYLQTNYPRNYAFFLHTAAGRPEEEFWDNSTNTAFTLPPKEELEKNAELMATVYKYDLRSRGLDDEVVEGIVADAIKKNKLKEKSLVSYGTIESAQAAELEAVKEATRRSDKEFEEAVAGVTTQIAGTIEKDIAFVVPEAKKPEFKQYVLDNLRFQNGKFYVVQELDGKTLKNQVEALLFQFNKGDLSTIVKKAATTEATQRLKLSLDRSNHGAQRGGTGNNTAPANIPLGSI